MTSCGPRRLIMREKQTRSSLADWEDFCTPYTCDETARSTQKIQIGGVLHAFAMMSWADACMKQHMYHLVKASQKLSHSLRKPAKIIEGLQEMPVRPGSCLSSGVFRDPISLPISELMKGTPPP